MQFKEAAAFVVPFGRYKGQTIDAIAESDDGLGYLEWLRDQRAESKSNYPIDVALNTYLNDQTIKRECENANDNRRRSWE